MKTNVFIYRVFVISLLIFTIASEAAAQRGAYFKDKDNPNQVYFWFNVKLSKSVAKVTMLEEYQLRLVSSTIYHGTLKAYQKALWQGTVQGSKIAVGPFTRHEDAAAALGLYKMVKDTVTARDMVNERHWFLVKVNIMERSHSYQFERMASRVASGKSAEFSDVLRESLHFKTLAIGPFPDVVEAEQAKSIYRIEE